MQIKHPNVLSIAGVDPSGGAGLLADVKTISSLGGYATGVVTAATAQNTQGVFGVIPIPTDFVKKQIDVLFEDVRIDSVKIGMLFDSNLIKGVAERLRYWNPRYIVLDPVMVAKSGDALLTDDAVATLRDELLPLATVICPRLLDCLNLSTLRTMSRWKRLLMTFGNSKAVTAGSISKAVIWKAWITLKTCFTTAAT